MGLTVLMAKSFKKVYNLANNSDLDKFDDFIEHLENKGFVGLPGRNKNSNNASKDKRDFVDKAAYANKYHLWHYYIGIPYYIKQNRYKKYEFGDYVSEYIIHYQMVDNNTVKLVKLDNHKPFAMPSELELGIDKSLMTESFKLLKELLF